MLLIGSVKSLWVYFPGFTKTTHQVFIDSDHRFGSEDHDGDQRGDPDGRQEGVKVLVADHPPGPLHRQGPLALAAGRVLDDVPGLLNVDTFHFAGLAKTVFGILCVEIKSSSKIFHQSKFGTGCSFFRTLPIFFGFGGSQLGSVAAQELKLNVNAGPQFIARPRIFLCSVFFSSNPRLKKKNLRKTFLNFPSYFFEKT